MKEKEETPMATSNRSSKDAKAIKAMDGLLSFLMIEGGAGSGRYPAGSSGNHGGNGKAPKYFKNVLDNHLMDDGTSVHLYKDSPSAYSKSSTGKDHHVALFNKDGDELKGGLYNSKKSDVVKHFKSFVNKGKYGTKETEDSNSTSGGPRAWLDQVFAKVVPKDMSKVSGFIPESEVIVPVTDVKTPEIGDDAETKIMEMIADTPEMNASTFFNLLKSKGIKFFLPKSVEADSSSGNAQALRSQEAGDQSQGNINLRSVKFLEASSPQDKTIGYTKFKVVLIQEGLGNLKDSFFYSRTALESGIPVFEGKKIYADHPTAIEESTRPERSVRDVLGHFENVHVEEGDTGQAILVGDVVILPDEPYRWARALMGHAVDFSEKYPDKEFVGLSINANGDANEISIDDVINSGQPESVQLKLNKAKESGIQTVRLVSKLTSAVSCDLVTEAGAGGKVLEMLEGNKHKESKMSEEKPKENEEKKEAAPAMDVKPEHKDEKQDLELIKKYVAKYMGDEKSEPSEEECGIVKEAMEAYKEMGEAEESAMSKACEALKLGKHMSAKKEKAMSEEKPKENEEKKEAADPKEEEAHKESLIELKAENAKLKESLRTIEINDHIEKICKESKLPVRVTNEFKSALGAPKSVDEVNKAWKIFESAFKSTTGEASSGMFEGIMIAPEKTVPAASRAKGTVDFGGIVKE